MARYEIADMNTGEPNQKREAREAASFAKFLAKCADQDAATNNGFPDSDYDSHGRYNGAPVVPAVLDDIEF